MNRRSFTKSSLAIGSILQIVGEEKIDQTMNKSKLGIALKKGDKIGVVSPSSSISSERLEQCKKQIESLGFEAVFGRFTGSKNGFLAGTDKERVSDIHDMFRDKSIKAIWCSRGGYGGTRILKMLDYKMISENPKPFIGYSDITAFHNAFYKKCKLTSFHGPIASGEMKGISLNAFQNIFLNNEATTYEFSKMELLGDTSKYDQLETIAGGIAKGKLFGGNLTVLTALVGTEYLPNFKNSIIFLEDVDEQPYRVDRMLTQLLDSTNLSKASGIILGQFTNCDAKDPSSSSTLIEVLKERLGGLGIPVLAGCPFGHVGNNVTIPVGLEAQLNATNKVLSFGKVF
jgi:muramoyltetrapeptide carboxypeptidase